MQPEWLRGQRLAAEIFNDAAIFVLNSATDFQPVLQPGGRSIGIGAGKQLNAVNVAGQTRQLAVVIVPQRLLERILTPPPPAKAGYRRNV
jgi:hypothetical protein